MAKKRRGHGEGSIYQQTDGRWTAAITLENKKRKVFYGKTRKEVQEKLKQVLHEQQQGTLMTSPQQTIAQFLSQWVEGHKQSVRPRTYERYESFIRLHVVPAIGHIQLQKLTPQHLKALYTEKLKSLSSSTVYMLHMMLHRALDDAIRWGLVARNVCDAVSAPRKSRYEITPLTREQAQVLLSAAKGHSMEALFVLALTTGMRRGELLALKWQDIDFTQSMLQVRRIFTRAKGRRYVSPNRKRRRAGVVFYSLP